MKLLKRSFIIAAALTLFVGAAPVYSAAEKAAVPASAGTKADSSYFETVDKAAVYVREQMTLRNTEVVVSLPNDTGLSGGTLLNTIVDLACKETGKSNEGDYLRLSLKNHGGWISRSENTVTIGIKLGYFTNASQEAEVGRKISSVLASFKVSDKSSYEKIKAVYEYVTANVAYSHDLNKDVTFSAYGGLSGDGCVCQGYAQIIYRMLRELNVPVRIICGTGVGGGTHAWNIAEIDGKYYYLDATYDAGTQSLNHKYFLKGKNDFDSFTAGKHTPSKGKADLPNIEPDYTSDSFCSLYPISDTAYVQPYMVGDIDGDGLVDSFDEIKLRSGIIYGFKKQVEHNAADINGDGAVKVNDLVMLQSYLLRRSAGLRTE